MEAIASPHLVAPVLRGQIKVVAQVVIRPTKCIKPGPAVLPVAISRHNVIHIIQVAPPLLRHLAVTATTIYGFMITVDLVVEQEHVAMYTVIQGQLVIPAV